MFPKIMKNKRRAKNNAESDFIGNLSTDNVFSIHCVHVHCILESDVAADVCSAGEVSTFFSFVLVGNFSLLHNTLSILTWWILSIDNRLFEDP